jgi:hypothetical protein
MQKYKPLRSKAAQAGIHLALSMEDIRNADWTPSPETNDWHRSEAARLAGELRDELEAGDIRKALKAMRKEESAERWARRWAKITRRFVGSRP